MKRKWMFLAMLVIAIASIPEGMAQVQASGPEIAAPTWSYVRYDSLSQDNVHCLGVNQTKGIIYGGTSFNYLYKSTNMGATWSIKDSRNGLRAPFGFIEAMLVLPSGDLVVSTLGGVFRSTDDGESFHQVCADGGYAFLRIRSGAIICGKGNGGGVYKSTDNGETWTVIADSLLTTASHFTGFAESRSGILLATTSAAYTAEGILRSTDGGKTWTHVINGLTETNFVSIASDPKSSPEKIYAMGYSNGTFVTEDGGLNWFPVAELTEKDGGAVFATSQTFYFGFLTKRLALYQSVGGAYLTTNFPLGIMVLAGCKYDDRHDLIGTNGGILLATYPQVTSVENQVPSSFSLSQNYPNPFNPSTTIQFSLPTRTNVSLAVYNALGQVVETLVAGEMEAGIHQTIWNAGKYPSGMYFYQIETTGFKMAKKMLLVK